MKWRNSGEGASEPWDDNDSDSDVDVASEDERE
jgi:hypothetical protein